MSQVGRKTDFDFSLRLQFGPVYPTKVLHKWRNISSHQYHRDKSAFAPHPTYRTLPQRWECKIGITRQQMYIFHVHCILNHIELKRESSFEEEKKVTSFTGRSFKPFFTYAISLGNQSSSIGKSYLLSLDHITHGLNTLLIDDRYSSRVLYPHTHSQLGKILGNQ